MAEPLTTEVLLSRWALDDPHQRQDFVEFMTSETFPMHRRHTWTRAQVEAHWGSGREGTRLFRGTADDLLVGYVELEGIDDDSVTFDLRVAHEWRGQRIGRQMLEQLCVHAFTELPAARLEGVTRVDNLPMRRVFSACGFVLESFYRAGWDATVPIDAVGYSRLKTDWTSGTITPIPWAQLLSSETDP